MSRWTIGLIPIVLVAAVFGLVLQTTLFQIVEVTAVVPDLLLVLCVYIGLHRHSIGGSLTAFLIGYFNDSFAGNLVGLHAFTMTFVFLAVYLLSRRLWTDHVLANMAIVFGAALVKGVTVAVLLSSVLDAAFPWGRFLSTVWLEAAVAALVAPLVFALLDGSRRTLGID